MSTQPEVVEPEYLLAADLQLEVEYFSQPIVSKGRPSAARECH